MMERTNFITLYFIFAIIISFFLGKKRQIGFVWCMFFCLTLSPVGGFLIAFFSKKYDEPNPIYSLSNSRWGSLLIVLFSGGMFSQLLQLANDPNYFYAIDAFVVQIGMIGLGIYLTKIGKGKSFNKKIGY